MPPQLLSAPNVRNGEEADVLATSISGRIFALVQYFFRDIQRCCEMGCDQTLVKIICKLQRSSDRAIEVRSVSWFCSSIVGIRLGPPNGFEFWNRYTAGRRYELVPRTGRTHSYRQPQKTVDSVGFVSKYSIRVLLYELHESYSK